MNKSKGFTIIELLVVVAIIAVLAAIVLVNVTQYINQGKNAAIKGNMTTMLTNAAVHYDTHGHYGAPAPAVAASIFINQPGYDAPQDAADAANGGVANDVAFGCNAASCTAPATQIAQWCSCSALYQAGSVLANTTFCVD